MNTPNHQDQIPRKPWILSKQYGMTFILSQDNEIIIGNKTCDVLDASILKHIIAAVNAYQAVPIKEEKVDVERSNELGREAWESMGYKPTQGGDVCRVCGEVSTNPPGVSNHYCKGKPEPTYPTIHGIHVTPSYKESVKAAFERGEKIQIRDNRPEFEHGWVTLNHAPCWDWTVFTYRIVGKPAPTFIPMEVTDLPKDLIIHVRGSVEGIDVQRVDLVRSIGEHALHFENLKWLGFDTAFKRGYEWTCDGGKTWNLFRKTKEEVK